MLPCFSFHHPVSGHPCPWSSFSHEVKEAQRVQGTCTRDPEYVMKAIQWFASRACALKKKKNWGNFPGGPGGSGGKKKKSACSVGNKGSIPGSGRSPGEEMVTHSGILAWRIPWERSLVGYSPWGQRDGHDWVTNTGDPVVKTLPSSAGGVGLIPLVRELSSHMLQDQKK